MTNKIKLLAIKLVHTIVWILFNLIIFYMLYAAVTDQLDIWLWLGYAIFLAEGLVLLIFRSFCPLTIIARKYSNSKKANFDIFLPVWLAKYNKHIYSAILLVILIITIIRLLK